MATRQECAEDVCFDESALDYDDDDLAPSTAEVLMREVESRAKELGVAVCWESDESTGCADPDEGIEVPRIRRGSHYLVCMHEIGHLCPYPSTDWWCELLEGSGPSAGRGEDEVEAESLAWVWAIENSSTAVTDEMLSHALECISSYEEAVEEEEGPTWRRGPARRELARIMTEGRRRAFS